MQMKLLNVALATALTAVLTGCGSSDGDATYNKQTVAPIDVGSGTSSTELQRLKSELADAKAKGTATEEKLKALQKRIDELSGKNDKDDQGETKPEKGDGEEKGDGNKKDDDAVVVAPSQADPKNNSGAAANTDKTVEEDNVVGFQAYDRGVSTQFDRTLNPTAENTGNATVINHNELENKVLSNIVLARPSVNRVPKTIYAGETANKVLDFNFDKGGQLDLQLDMKSHDGENNHESLQNKNVSLVYYNNNDMKYDDTNEVKTTNDKPKYHGEDYQVGQIFDTTDKAKIAELEELGIIGKDNKAIKPYQLERNYVAPESGSSRGYKLNALVEDIQYVIDPATGVKFASNTGLKVEEKDQLDQLSHSAYKSGLVRTYSQEQGVQGDGELLGKDASSSKRFVVRGQDRAVTKVEDGKLEVLHRTGFEKQHFNDVDDKTKSVNGKENTVRIFGSLYRDVKDINGEDQTGDIPQQVWSAAEGKFIDNGEKDSNGKNHYDRSIGIFSMSAGTPNSYQHTSADANEDIRTLEELNDKYFVSGQETESRKFGQYRAGLTAKPIHLNHVQYGRVTVRGDDNDLIRIQNDFKKKGYEKSLFTLANKLTPKNGERVTNLNKKDTTVDFYFARALQDTKEMPKEGKVTYLGHALAYGLDNSFHEESTARDNTVISRKKEGVGNFVRADVDFKDATVKGSIYNVWIDADSPYKNEKGTAVENDLVILDGKITPNHNSVIGDATLAYGSKDKGSFKGAFYGNGAAELGGQFNSITEGYGEAKWGGVFGAKKITSSKIDITNHTEQQE